MPCMLLGAGFAALVHRRQGSSCLTRTLTCGYVVVVSHTWQISIVNDTDLGDMSG